MNFNDWRGLDPLLIELWADFSIPAREIAERLGVTKNAVIGRAHRLRLEKRPVGFGTKRVSRDVIVGVRPPRSPRPKKTVQKPVPIIPTKEPPKRDRFGHFVSASNPKETPLRRDAKGHFISAKTGAEKLPPRVERGGPITILELDSHTCRWPFGDRSPFLYCGRPPFEASVYCEEHSRIAYNGKAPKRPQDVGRTSAGRRF